MKEKEVQKIIAQTCFKRGLLAGAKEYADVVFRTVDDPDVLEKLLIDFKVLGIKLAKANVEVEVVDLREEQEEEKDAKKETAKCASGQEESCAHCGAFVSTHYKYCPHCGILMLRRQANED